MIPLTERRDMEEKRPRLGKAKSIFDEVRIEHGGENLTLREWADRLGLRPEGMRQRYNDPDWTDEETVTVPKGKQCAAGRAREDELIAAAAKERNKARAREENGGFPADIPDEIIKLAMNRW